MNPSWSVPALRPCVSLHTLLTLDGYLADPSLPAFAAQWQRVDTDACSQFMLDRSDVLILGRHTYQNLIADSEWPYLEHQAYVMTTRNDLYLNSSFLKTSSLPLTELLHKLHAEQQHQVWLIGGSKLVNTALAADLLDELVIHMLPFAQGSGQAFFTQPNWPDFELLDVQRLEHGLIRMHYKVVRDA